MPGPRVLGIKSLDNLNSNGKPQLFLTVLLRMKLNRRDNNSGADEPASIQNTDVLVKLTWMCVLRLAELSALEPAAENKSP